MSQAGALAQALKMSSELYPIVHSLEGQYRLRRRVRSLNYALQKAGWEQALAEYRKKNRKEPTNLAELRPLVLSQLRDIASIVPENEPDDLKPILQEAFRFRYDPAQKTIEPQQALVDIDVDIAGVHLPEGGT